MVELKKETYEKLYQLLEIGPINMDCGELCNKLCCMVNDPELGIYLYPGEEKMLTGNESWFQWQVHNVKDYNFPPSWKGQVNFIRCNGTCPRGKRPLQCRIFPLAPHIDENGKLHIIWDTLDLPYTCPLIADKVKLNPEFINNAFRVCAELIKIPLIRDLIVWDSSERFVEKLEITSLKSE